MQGEAEQGEAFIPNAHFYCVAFSLLALAFLFPLALGRLELDYWYGTGTIDVVKHVKLLLRLIATV